VTHGDTYIIDGRTTPIDFGRAGAAPRALAFGIQNHGSVDLTTSGLELPPGFSLVGEFPSSVAPGATANFQVQLENTVPGSKFGQIRFRTSDADEGDFNFNIKGTALGPPPPNAPRIDYTSPAVVYINSGEPRLIAPTARVFDADSTSFNTGQLKVEFASGGNDDDRLAIRHEGTAAGRIGVAGDVVSFGGVSIGSFSGGQGETPLLVTFNAHATLEAVQALVRNLTFANISHEPAANHRYVRLTLVDDAGNTSNMLIAHALVDPRPILPGDFNGNGQVEQADLDLVLLHWGQEGAGTPPTWTGPPATGLVDQEELDAVLLNWGVAAAALAAPAQVPLIEATVRPVPQSSTATDITRGDALADINPAKSARRSHSPSAQFGNGVREDVFAHPRNWLSLP
jgi:hypothetical protein